MATRTTLHLPGGATNTDVVTNDDGTRVLAVQLEGSSSTTILNTAGRLIAVETSFARPADTTAYAAKDAVSNSTSAPTVLTFTNLARESGGSGYIAKARLWTDQAANVAQFRLHLFHTTPTAINDNAAQTLLWANRSKRIGYIDFAAMQTEGTGSDAANSQVTDVWLPFTCATGSRNLLGLLETLTIFTPASAQQFYVELTADVN